MNRNSIAMLCLLAIIALAIRVPMLDSRPMHNDEAVNAIKLGALMEKGEYHYDPSEYHGPTLVYASELWVKLLHITRFASVTEKHMRWVTILFGTGLVLLLIRVADGLGSRAALVAGLFTAISPAMVFYSRYYIHEMLLVFFTFTTLVAAWRYRCAPGAKNAIAIGVSIGLMHATKETFVLALAAMSGALIMQKFLKPLNTASHPSFRFAWKHVWMGITAWLLVSMALFSSFFTSTAGWMDSFRTYAPWAHRMAGASPHIHGWSFYLERLLWYRQDKITIWSEGLIFLLSLPAIYTGIVGGRMKNGSVAFVRFLSLYTLILTFIYCAIGYKTPWCMLGFWHGFILLAGVGTVMLYDSIAEKPVRLGFCGLVALSSLRLTSQAWLGSTQLSYAPGNPYIYSQTSPDILRLVSRVEAVSRSFPSGNEMPIRVMSPQSDYWPLPYYLRSFSTIGWHDDLTESPHIPVLIASTELKAAYETNGTHVMIGLFKLRPGKYFELYVEKHLYKEYVRSGGSKNLDD
jgi:uncharacterized protein (TIGR03663 family)